MILVCYLHSIFWKVHPGSKIHCRHDDKGEFEGYKLALHFYSHSAVHNLFDKKS